ncbi:MAG: DHH family phosphoesterase, partial [Thermodesulfobacteriota bacterium]|nr:DHH family phosphoesterase [Thermodesulfobacteriota bacterium]
MDIILTHARADFDAFASMLCAGKLFPQAVPVLPSTLIYKLREVLSLYRNLADFRQIRFLRKTKDLILDKVILVDTKKHGQLKEFKPFLEKARSLVIYDHHPPTLDDITTGSLELFPYGANTTGLFFKLMDQGLDLTPQEATIVLLGIYADTGNLTYPGTTAEDALAAGELLGLEADLQTVNNYLRPYFDPAQRFVFREMLSSLQEMDMAGYKVVIVKQMLEKPLQGISELISHVSDMVGADAIVGIFASESKPGVQIIVQSLAPEINAGEITARFGGGGHPGAGAA